MGPLFSRSKNRLSTYLLGRFIVLLLAFILVLSFFIIRFMVQPSRDRAIQNMYREMDLVDKVIQLNMERYAISVNLISQGLDRFDDANLHLNKVSDRMRYETYLRDVLVLDPNGFVIYQQSSDKDLMGYRVNGFVENAYDDIRVLKGEEIGTIYMIKQSDERVYVFEIGLEDIAESDFESINDEHDWIIYNDQGEVFLSSLDRLVIDLGSVNEKHEMLINEKSYVYQSVFANTKRYVEVNTQNDSYESQLSISIRVPEAVFYAQDRYYRLLMLSILVIFILVTALIVLGIRKELVRPINILSTSMLSRGMAETVTQTPDSNLYEVQKLYQNYYQMGTTIEEKEQRLKEFVYIASHDLQEPLRVITNYIKILEMEVGEVFEGDTAKYFDYVSDGAKRMKVLIEELLVYSRATEKPLDKQAIDLADVIGVVEHQLKVQIQEKDAIISVVGEATVMADPYGMEMILQNLISNGIKYNENKPEILVTITDQEIAIQDNGIGIDEDYFDTIMKPFSRLHNKSDYSGTGIGMAIVQKVIERHGWQYKIQSALGQGTIFTIIYGEES